MTYTQPTEVCVDTGYQHIGISVKSKSKEYVSEEYILLRDEERKDRLPKYAYYAFYPAHLLALGLITRVFLL